MTETKTNDEKDLKNFKRLLNGLTVSSVGAFITGTVFLIIIISILILLVASTSETGKEIIVTAANYDMAENNPLITTSIYLLMAICFIPYIIAYINIRKKLIKMYTTKNNNHSKAYIRGTKALKRLRNRN